MRNGHRATATSQAAGAVPILALYWPSSTRPDWEDKANTVSTPRAPTRSTPLRIQSFRFFMTPVKIRRAVVPCKPLPEPALLFQVSGAAFRGALRQGQFFGRRLRLSVQRRSI